MNITNIKVENLSKVAYKCYIQQLLVLCQYYCGEYWKIFLNNNLSIKKNDNSDSQLKKHLLNENDYRDALKKYYGISLIETKDKMYFTKLNEIYLLSISAEEYPIHSNSFTNPVYHYFLVYGETDKDYIVHDNYYNTTDLHIDKKMLEMKALKKYKIENKNDTIAQVDLSHLVYKIVQENIYEKWLKLIDIVNDSNPIIFLNTISELNEYLDQSLVVLKGYFKNNLYLDVCNSILAQIVEKVNLVYYSVVKEIIKHEEIKITFFQKKFSLITDYLLVDKKVKSEIMKISSNNQCYIDTIKKNMECFLEITISTKNRLCDDGIDQYTLLALLSYFELEYNINDINVLNFSVNNTYEQVLLLIYKYVLSEQKSHNIS